MTLANSMILVDQTALPLATPAFNGHGGKKRAAASKKKCRKHKRH
jgi:hypothetical protein